MTIKGINAKNGDGFKERVYEIASVVEGANRAYMALDEHLHAGSTLYIPINVFLKILFSISNKKVLQSKNLYGPLLL